LPSRLEGLILRLGPDGQRAPRVTLLRADARGDVVTAPAIFGRALHRDDGIPTIIESRRPTDTGLAGRTGRVLLAPINLKVLGIKAIPCAGLPVIVETRGPEEIDAVVIQTLDQECRVENARVHARSPGSEAALLPCRVDLGGGLAIRSRAGRGFDVGDEMGHIILTRVGHRPLVAHPRGRVLAGVVGVGVVGRADERRRRGNVVRLAPREPGAVSQIMLAPDPAQDGDGGHLTQPRRCVRGIDSGA
jgi:hypothetical protein